MTITVFLCVKDGAEFIEAWLENTKPADKIIIYDGGSIDGTREIIASAANNDSRITSYFDNEHTEKFKWNEASIRNKFLGKFETDWVLLQDVDELVEDSFWDWFPNAYHEGKIGYYIGHYNLWLDKSLFRMDPPWYPDYTLRLFRPEYFMWVGAEHGSLWKLAGGNASLEM